MMGFLFNRLGFFMSHIISSFIRLIKLDIHLDLFLTLCTVVTTAPGQHNAADRGAAHQAGLPLTAINSML
jgi:hypothetical protein